MSIKMEAAADWNAIEVAFFEELPSVLAAHSVLTAPTPAKQIGRKLYSQSFDMYMRSLTVLLERCELATASAEEPAVKAFMARLGECLVDECLRDVRPNREPPVETRFTVALFLVPGIQEYPASRLHLLADEVLIAWKRRCPAVQLGKGNRAQIESGFKRSLLDWVTTAFQRKD